MAHCRLKGLYCVDLSVRLFLYTCWDQKDLVTDPMVCWDQKDLATDPMVLFQYLRSKENYTIRNNNNRAALRYCVYFNI